MSPRAPLAPNARLTEVVPLRDDLRLFRVAPDAGAIRPFEPGQFAMLGLEARPQEGGHFTLRAYSIASPPSWSDHLQLLVERVEGGRLTEALWQLGEGDRIFLDPRPRGRFTLARVPEGGDVLLVSTGTGLAPFVSMLRAHAEDGRLGRAALLHGARTVEHLALHDELTALAAARPGWSYLPTLTREPEDSPYDGLRGRVHAHLDAARVEALTGLALDDPALHVFLCGNAAMVTEATRRLAPLGYSRDHPSHSGRLHCEAYGASLAAQAGQPVSAT